MPVKISDSINDCSISWLELSIKKITFDTNVVVTGKYLQGIRLRIASRIPGIS